MYKWLPLVFLTLFLVAPDPASAQVGRLVVCDGVDIPCDFCQLVDIGKRIVDFLITIAIVIATIIIVIAGIRLATSAGNVQAKEDAKKYLTNAIIGLILVLASWLVIDTIMKILVQQEGSLGGSGVSFGPWNELDCPRQPSVTPGDTTVFIQPNFDGLQDLNVTERAIGGAGGGGTCDTIDDPNNACHPSNLGCFGANAENASQVCNKESGGAAAMSQTDMCADGNSFSGGQFQINVLAHADRIPGCSSDSFTTSGGGPQGSCLREVTNSNNVTYCAMWNCRFTSQSAYSACQQGALDQDLNTEIACDLYQETGGFDPWRLSANLCGVTQGVRDWTR